MAEKADKNDDVNALKRRGRRRLVGAIALVLLAVIILPMVFDSEPRGSTPPPVSVRIPGEEESGFAPRVIPKAQEKALEKVAEKAPEKAPEKAAEKAEEKKDAPKAEEKKDAPKAEAPKVEPPKAEEKKVSQEGQFFIPVAALATPEKLDELLAKLKSAKLPYYTEPLATKAGPVTRVRVGPFASREAADKALAQLKGLGLKPGNVATKS